MRGHFLYDSRCFAKSDLPWAWQMELAATVDVAVFSQGVAGFSVACVASQPKDNWVGKAVKIGRSYQLRAVSRAKGSSNWIRSPCCKSGNRSIESAWNSQAELCSKPLRTSRIVQRTIERWSRLPSPGRLVKCQMDWAIDPVSGPG